MAWIWLLIAGLLEVAWAIGLKYTFGFTRFWPTVWTIVTMIASFWFLAQAAKSLPLGTAYAIWTGIGVVGTTILGIVLFDEVRSWPRLACLAMIFGGIVGLKLSTSAPP